MGMITNQRQITPSYASPMWHRVMCFIAVRMIIAAWQSHRINLFTPSSMPQDVELGRNEIEAVANGIPSKPVSIDVKRQKE